VGSVELVGDAERKFNLEEADGVLKERTPRPDLKPHPELSADTRLWAALVQASGGRLERVRLRHRRDHREVGEMSVDL
jgi:hypothetical protein